MATTINHEFDPLPETSVCAFCRWQVRVVAITENIISNQDQVRAIHFDPRSDQGQIILVILRKFQDQIKIGLLKVKYYKEKIKIKKLILIFCA